MSSEKSGFFHKALAEMRVALPFTKFTVAVGWGIIVGTFLGVIYPVGNWIAVGSAIIVAIVFGYLFRSPS
jgi:uncharacterized membrane protein YjjP (DUF1212 family)